MTSTINTSTTTTDAPCPWWCALPAGHGWDLQVIGEPCLERAHQHLIGEITHGNGALYIDVSVYERIVQYPSGVLGDVTGFPDPPAVSLSGDPAEYLTGAQARACAAMLVEAGALLDRVAAGR